MVTVESAAKELLRRRKAAWHEYDLYWHALNYRTAGTAEAEEMWQELVACHERILGEAMYLARCNVPREKIEMILHALRKRE